MPDGNKCYGEKESKKERSSVSGDVSGSWTFEWDIQVIPCWGSDIINRHEGSEGGSHMDDCTRQKDEQVQRPWGRRGPGCLRRNKEAREGASVEAVGPVREWLQYSRPDMTEMVTPEVVRSHQVRFILKAEQVRFAMGVDVSYKIEEAKMTLKCWAWATWRLTLP